MICRKCQTSNPDSSVYCSGCGAPLLRRPMPKKNRIPWVPMAAGAAVLLVLLSLLYFLFLRSPKLRQTKDIESLGETASPPAPLENGPTSLAVGEATVYDNSNNEMTHWNLALFDDGWIALPVAALLGGSLVFFQAGDSVEVRIERGIWSAGDPVALWRVGTGFGLNLPELSAWQPTEPLSWHSLGPSHPGIPVNVVERERKGSLIVFPIPEELKYPGVLIQDNGVVGWTFGNGLDRGYLWSGHTGGCLKPSIDVDRFAVSVSASREADFSRAWSIKGTRPPQERLEIFARGFLRPQSLSAGDIPPPLRKENVIAEMHELATALTREGQGEAVLRLLDFQVLLESAEPLLIQDAVLAMVESKDHNRGIQYLENFKKDYFAARRQSLSGLESFHAQLYKDWLREIISKGGYFSAMSAFEAAKKAFPDDPEIHLLGVEAAISEEDYGRAQELLQARTYPPLLKDRVSRLESEAKAKKEESEALTIRFNPGEEHIPVYADINGRYRLKFIVDTGAQMCTIPPSAMEPLGIRIDDRTAVNLVTGVGGTGLAYEVTLESVSVKGVKAVIVDLSFYPGCGLLGLNFLDQFRYEIDRQKGILRLSRR
jgi:predicted aspartyl protease